MAINFHAGLHHLATAFNHLGTVLRIINHILLLPLEIMFTQDSTNPFTPSAGRLQITGYIRFIHFWGDYSGYNEYCNQTLENSCHWPQTDGVAYKILIAPDKFKGTLTARQAAKAIARGWKAARPKDKLTQLPISDGGDGFGPLMANALHASPIPIESKDAAGNKIEALIWQTDDRVTLIESANLTGLAMLPEKQRNPLAVDSAGLGLALQSDATQNSSHCFIGIGGSATNDGGFGMATALGWSFINKDQQPISFWSDLAQLKSIKSPKSQPSFPLTACVDVQNPLLGPNGCTRVFGPQKGMREEDIPKAEAALTRLAEVWEAQTGEDAASLPGAGAAGGLGFGVHCFAGSEIRSGFEIYSEAAGVVAKLAETDVVITGEGTMDHQTIMGKGVGELTKLAINHNCRCIGLAGNITNRTLLLKHVENCRALTDITTLADAKKDAAQWLEKLAHDTAQSLNSPT